MSTPAPASPLRALGMDLYAQRKFLPALGAFSEAVRRVPQDHRARMMAARCYLGLGENERAVLALHTCAEGLLHRDYLLSALAACKLALDLNPQEKLVRDTLGRLHARAVRTAPGRASVPPPLPPEVVGDTVVVEDLMTLSGSALADRAIEVLMTPDSTPALDPHTRPPLPLFAELTPEAFLELVPLMVFHEAAPGTPITVEGEGGDSLFVLVAGEAQVSRRVDGYARKLGVLPGGSMFGEVSVLTGTLPSASVTASAQSELLEIRKEALGTLSRAHPTVPQTLADFAQHRMARNLMASSALFAPLAAPERLTLLQQFQFRALAPGERVLVEGEHSDGLYLVLAGELVVQKDDPSGGSVTLSVLHEGDVAGEISLLTGLRATATVAATRKTAAAFLPRAAFHPLLSSFPQVRTHLESLSSRRLKEIGDALRPPEVLDADEFSSYEPQG